MIAKLHIQTFNRNGITCLKETFFTPPFKVANITEDRRAKDLHLMIMNSSPGILDGDQYSIRIDVSEDSSLQLHTQSYQRVFTMKGSAYQSTEVYLQENSSFIFLPHPSVPHEHSNFTTHNKIFLKESSTLIWGEIITCGRKLSMGGGGVGGEIFSFSTYHAITEVFRDNKLIIKENLLMQPSVIDPLGLGQLEGYTHQASMICVCPGGNDIEEIHAYLTGQEDIMAGVTTTTGKGMLVRLLGHGAEQLYKHLQAICFLARQQQLNHVVKKSYAR